MSEPRPYELLSRITDGIRERADTALNCAEDGRYDLAADCLGDAAAIAQHVSKDVLKDECEWTGESMELRARAAN